MIASKPPAPASPVRHATNDTGLEAKSRQLNLDPARLTPLEIGAMLVSVLAFPRPGEESAGSAAAEALCARVVAETIIANPDKVENLRRSYPEYVAIDNKECRHRLRQLSRRLRDRMVASRMSLRFFEDGIRKLQGERHPSVDRFTIKALSNLVKSGSGQRYAKNVRQRTWAQTRPVIHLAAAVQVTIRELAPDEERFGYSLDDAELHAKVICLARKFEKIVLSDKRFGKCADELIRIRIGPEPA